MREITVIRSQMVSIPVHFACALGSPCSTKFSAAITKFEVIVWGQKEMEQEMLRIPDRNKIQTDYLKMYGRSLVSKLMHPYFDISRQNTCRPTFMVPVRFKPSVPVCDRYLQSVCVCGGGGGAEENCYTHR